MMKRLPLLLLLAFLAALPALAVEVPAGAAATAPAVTAPAAAPVTATVAAAESAATLLGPNSSPEIRFVVICPQCPIYPDIGCSCEWIFCNGAYICGRPR
jgi:predicted RNA-binding Zn ribbon-like protein